ncbi:MAG: transcriptional regulator PpsR [Acidiphilium sp. 37-64-53]|uniref:transcriptional regulator PpsR n=1 Tax=Acidiphilium TaxID=522 RepID=UPI000BDC473C|nr:MULTISPECIES: transcriptional regulator PpsR [Acidiphilium]OYW02501.1 MAG: transcriptional regulator PpsR [Acidiphilium sp. 37-64-53]HQT84914.1 transcriptional regulator PpsR [Acidiphilium rubrum]
MTTVNLAQPDLTLHLDRDGVIRDTTLSDRIETGGLQPWHGRPWSETVTASGFATIERMVKDAWRTGVSAFTPVNQLFPSGAELPLEYTTVRLGGDAGLLAIGRRFHVVADLQSRLIAAQQAMERDHWRLRDVEIRYNLMFNGANDPLLLLDAATLRITEVNPAAGRLLGIGHDWSFIDQIAKPSQPAFHAMIQRARTDGQAPGVIVQLGTPRESWIVRASLADGGVVPSYLLHLTPVAASPRGTTLPDRSVCPALIARLPDAFVIIDRDGVVRQANAAFLDLIEAASDAVVLGGRLDRWLDGSGNDLAMALELIRNHGRIMTMPSVIHGEYGAVVEVEISASSDDGMIGLLIRDTTRRATRGGVSGRDPLQAALGALSLEVGPTTIHEAVDQTVAAVEQHFIRAALEQTAGNRKAAAALIGLSRQSLYLKMNRYDLE